MYGLTPRDRPKLTGATQQCKYKMFYVVITITLHCYFCTRHIIIVSSSKLRCHAVSELIIYFLFVACSHFYYKIHKFTFITAIIKHDMQLFFQIAHYGLIPCIFPSITKLYNHILYDTVITECDTISI